MRVPGDTLVRRLADHIQRTIAPAAVQLRLWDGSSCMPAPARPIGELLVRDRRTLLGLVVNPDLWFGEAYMAGRVEIRGAVDRVIEALTALTREPSWVDQVRAVLALPNSLSASRRNVHHHYDLGNDFYEQWLDRQLVYTCAYFPDPEMTLEAAQRAKLDLVCRKVGLAAGDTVIEAGCGWGALALHMAREYGARVRAFNVSREQLAYARDRAKREGLTDRVEFIDDDYRNVQGQCDVFVSVGMLEHVGLRHYTTLASVLRRTVRPDGGRGLLHFIGRDQRRPLNAWIRRRIFPGAYPPTLPEVLTRIMAPAGMSVLDVDNLRLHYERTLAHWQQRFASVTDQVRERYGAEFQRAWELYLAGSRAAFAASTLQLFQVVFAPSASVPPYWTRETVYRRAEGSAWTAATR
jgi:cyclopropane-fatty-acyl-phospholipid synthase